MDCQLQQLVRRPDLWIPPIDLRMPDPLVGRSMPWTSLPTRKAAQSSIGSLSLMKSFIAWISSGECPCQPRNSLTTRSGSRERYYLVGLPGNFLSVTFGSRINVPVDSTRTIQHGHSTFASV